MTQTKENKAYMAAIRAAEKAQPAPKRRVYEKHPDGTELERTFDYYWFLSPYTHYVPVKNWVFCPERKFKVDRGFPDALIAVEMEGADHKMSDRYRRDVEKYNLMASRGIRLFRCTTEMLRDDPKSFIRMVAVAVMEAMSR